MKLCKFALTPPIGAISAFLLSTALSAFAVTENAIDYTTFVVGETPCGVTLSVFAGMDSRGLSWQLKREGLVSTEAQLLAPVRRTCAGRTFTDHTKNLGMDPSLVSHCAAFTGLAAGTYSYRIGAVYEGSGEHWTYGTFTVKAGPYEAVRILNLNDAQTKDMSAYWKYANTCATAAKAVGGADKIDFVLDGGDFFHMRGEKMRNAGANSNALNNVRWAMANETAALHLPGVPWVHVGGNHDDVAYALTCPEAFAITNSPRAQGTTYVGCHSLVIGNVYVATMPCCLDQKMAIEWLKADLAASQANASVKWRIVALHDGPYTTGDHAVSKRLGYAETATAFNRVVTLTPIFAANRVDLVLQAHDHTFVKTVPYRWSGKGYTTSETDAETLNLAPTTETEGGLVYDVDPKGTYYVSAGCAGHRVGENKAYADRVNKKSFVHRNLKIATGRIKVTSSVSAAGDDASKDTGKQMFGVLEASGDRLTYKFYFAADCANETSELYDYVAIHKTVGDRKVILK